MRLLVTLNRELFLDGWVYRTKRDSAELNFCLQQHGAECKASSTWKKFANQVNDTIAAGGKQMVVVNDMNWRNLSNILPVYQDFLQDHFHIRIVVTYRRLFEWLHSAYYQFYRFSCQQDVSPYVTDAKERALRLGPVQTFPQFLEMMGGGDYKYLKHPILHFQDEFRKYGFRDFVILNMHDDEDHTIHFVCHIMNATRACQKLIPSHKQTDDLDHNLVSGAAPAAGVANAGTPLHHMRMAQQAILRGIVDVSKNNETASCSQVYNNKFRRQEQSSLPNASLPLQCLPEESAKELLRASLQAEQQLLFPNNKNSNNEQQQHQQEVKHRDSFLTWSTTRMCDVDIDRVLSNPEWIKFLKETS